MQWFIEVSQSLASYVNVTALILIWIFDVSCYCGDILIHGIVGCVTLLWSFTVNLKILIQVLCDDYSVFLNDFWAKGVTISSTIRNSAESFFNSFISTTSFVLDLGLSTISNGASGLTFIFQILYQIVFFVANVVSLTYLSISYIGSSILAIIVNLPENAKLSCLFIAKASVSALRDSVDFLVLDIYGTVVRQFHSFTEALGFAILKSTSSIFAFFIGIVALLIFILYFKDILSFILTIIDSSVEYLCMFVSNCWSGEFFYRANNQDRRSVERQRAEPPAEVPSQPQTVERDDNLCIVCLTNPKNVLHMPCRHVCVCQTCSNLLDPVCPVCRMRIRRKLNIFI